MAGKVGRPRKNPLPAEKPILGPEGGELHPLDLAAQESPEARESVEKLYMQPVEGEVSRDQARMLRSDTKREGTGRQKRKPLGVPTQRLEGKVPEGMTGRWMNDTPGRLTRALEGGYQFVGDNEEVVQDRSGARSEIVGTGRDGGAMRAYLMAIPTILYERDKAAKAALIKEGSDAIQRGKPQQVADQDEGAYYTPSEGISLRDEVR